MKGQKIGGRKKGSINKIKPPQDVIRKVEAEAVANCIATGESPLAYMLRVMRDPTIEDPPFFLLLRQHLLCYGLECISGRCDLPVEPTLH
jgi:hypothetical protein